MVCCAPGGKRWDADCRECHDPEKRKQWGCDAETDDPVVELSPCPFCEGVDTECDHCAGTNYVPIRRCPNRLVTARERGAVMAAAQVELGILPDAGGWLDQAHTFVQAYPLLAQEIERWREYAREQARKRNKSQH